MMRRLALRLVLGGVGVYLVICTVMFTVQRYLVFHPSTRDVALAVQQVRGARVELLETRDGETLKSWWVPPATDDAAVYLYLHGNAATLASRAARLGFLTEQGAGVLAVSWRGYGGSTGSPTEAGLRLDADAAYEWLAARVAARRVIVFGESLGTALAVDVAAEHETAALVLDSAFTSVTDAARAQYPWLPVDWLLLDRFDSLALAPR
ncbi:MAG: alpha/beta hydrolase, partial [Pseudomonadales bacterium]|nr:alpha/beta hydrolase [Pseudomonadales bacterium]